MRFKKALEIWAAVELYFTGILAGIATGLAFYQVVSRYVVGKAPDGIEESVLYLVIWAVFVISSTLAREDGHVGSDIIINIMPYNIQRIVKLITFFLALIFCFILIFYGFKIVAFAFEMNEKSQTRLRFPMWVAYLAIPVGGCLIFLSYLHRLHNFIFLGKRKKPIDEDHEAGGIIN